jgi:hypothetical protein
MVGLADTAARSNWVGVAREVGPAFATRAADHDAFDKVVGAPPSELCAMLRDLGRSCS